MKKQVITILCVLCWTLFSNAQISEGGQPISFDSKYSSLKKDIPVKKTSPIDLAKIQKEDEEDEANGLPPRFGYPIEVNYSLENSGVWEDLPNGDRLWRLSIECKDANSINLLYEKFKLPKGAKLFLYNADKTYVIGAFTERNNKPDSRFATSVIKGNKITLEYYEPVDVSGKGEIQLSHIVHGYRFWGFVNQLKDFGQSGDCHYDVICDEGDNWRDELKSVAMLVVGGTRFCSGFLVNNIKEDCTPLFMTANHCLPTTKDAVSDPALTTWMFYWRYESPDCGKPILPIPGNDASDSTNDMPFETTTGAKILANPGNPGTIFKSDFALLKLTESPVDAGYDVYFAGFDATGHELHFATGIHHPKGDVKKISIENNPISVTAYGGGMGNTHWKVANWDIGVTEGGSSGSPLFYDSSKLAVGYLSGGSAACDAVNDNVDNNLPDYYGRFAHSWTNDGAADPRRRLKDWLDPMNTGTMSIRGRYPCKDFGDAPDDGEICLGAPRNYQTTLVNAGPRYQEFKFQRFGNFADRELDGQPNCPADGDDTNPAGEPDDEDGIVFVPGGVDIHVNIARPGLNEYLIDGWFDIDNDGIFNHPAERLVSRVETLAPGFYIFFEPLAFNGEDHYSRFRLTYGIDPIIDLRPYGEYLAADSISHGEVEDYSPAWKDYGDAPDNGEVCFGVPRNYQTIFANDGPRYREFELQKFGQFADAEIDGQPNCPADGDDINPAVGPDDEDGIVFVPGGVDIHANITRPGANEYIIDAWFDTNNNGFFDHPVERIISRVETLVPGFYTFFEPLGFNGEDYYSRFRLTYGVDPIIDLKPYGEYLATDSISHGEVEDYAPVEYPGFNKVPQAPEMIPGEPFYYTFDVNNPCPHPITNVTVVDVLSPNLQYIGDDYGGTYSNGTYTADIGTVAPQETVVIQIQVELDPNHDAEAEPMIYNTGELYYAEGPPMASQTCVPVLPPMPELGCCWRCEGNVPVLHEGVTEFDCLNNYSTPEVPYSWHPGSCNPLDTYPCDCVTPPDVIGTTDGPVCEEEPLTFTVTSDVGATYTWFAPDGTIVSTASVYTFNPTLAQNGETYTVIATSPDGCESAPFEAVVEVIACDVTCAASLNHLNVSCPSNADGYLEAEFTATASGDFTAELYLDGALIGSNTFTITPSDVGIPITIPIGNDLPQGDYYLTITTPTGYVCEAFATIISTDFQAPIIQCPDDITVQITDNDSAVVTWDAPVATDTCLVVTVSGSHNSGDNFAVGTTTVTYSATDDSGNTSTCSFDINVVLDEPSTLLSSKIILSVAYDVQTGLMSNYLRESGYLPHDSPYNTGDSTTTSAFNVTGNNAIVDWVKIELRDPTNPTLVIATRSALLQRDGDIVDLDGISPVALAYSGDYYVVIDHRNHLGIMSAAPMMLSGNVSYDFTTAQHQAYGTNAMMDMGGVYGMIGGDANGDGRIVYTGSGTDVNPISTDVLLNPSNIDFLPTVPVYGYFDSDLNMDGTVIYTGSGTEVNVISTSVLLHPQNTTFSPTFVIHQEF